MTEEKRDKIIQDIKRMIPDIARKHQVYNDDVEVIISSIPFKKFLTREEKINFIQ